MVKDISLDVIKLVVCNLMREREGKLAFIFYACQHADVYDINAPAIAHRIYAGVSRDQYPPRTISQFIRL